MNNATKIFDISYGANTTGDCKKLMIVRARRTKNIPPKNIATRGRESSFFPVCQFRTYKNPKTKFQKDITLRKFLI
jgi:hypothetical protein